MAQFEITDFPEIATLTDEENFVFYVKRVTDGQDYKIKLGNFQGMILDTVSGQGQDFIQQIVDQLLPQIESDFEQELEDQVSEAIASERIQREIELKINEILGEDFDNPYTTIIAEVNSVIDNARTNKKFSKEITLVNNSLDIVNNEKLPALQEDLDNLNNVVLPEVAATIAQVQQDLENLGSVDLTQLEESLEVLEQDLTTLNEDTLPNINLRLTEVEDDLSELDLTQLNQDLSNAQNQLDTLNTVTIPDINQTLSDVQGDISNLNNTTLPEIDSKLSQVESDLALLELEGEEINESIYIVEDVNSIINNAITEIKAAKGINQVNNLFPIQSTSISDNAITTPLLAANSIVGSKIAALAITGDKIDANTITGDKIVAGTLSAREIGALTITGNLIQGNTITGDKLVVNTITADQIATGTITADELASNSVTAVKIVSGAITTDKMTANSINGNRIATNTLDASKIIADSISAREIAALSITGNLIQGNTITGDKLIVNSISGDRITTNTLNGNKIIAGTISADRLVANSITADEIAALTITGDEIKANTITGDKIVVNSVNADRIVSNSITSNQIASNTIIGGNILGGTITGDKIQGNTITASLIASDAIEADAIKARVITGDKLAFSTITGDLIAADTITTKNLVISDFENLTYGSDFEVAEEIPWEGIDGVASIQESSALEQKALRFLPVSSGIKYAALNYNPDLKTNEELYLEYDLYTTSDWNGTGNSKLRIGDALNSNNLLAADAFVNTNNGWMERTFSYKYTGNPTRIQVSIGADHTQGQLWITNIKLRRKKAGNLIVDGTITATQIASEAITATKLSADAIDGKLITGTILRTSASDSTPRVVVGDPSFPLWYGTGNISTANMVFGLLSNGTAYAQNLVIEDNSVFKGTLTGASGTFGTITSGNIQGTTLSSNTITGNTITGGSISGTTITGTTISGNTITGGSIVGTTLNSATGTFSGEITAGRALLDEGLSVDFDTGSEQTYLKVGRNTDDSIYEGVIIGMNAPVPYSSNQYTSRIRFLPTAMIMSSNINNGITPLQSTNFSIQRDKATFSGGNVEIVEDLMVNGTISNFTGAHPVNFKEGNIPEVGDLVEEHEVDIKDNYNAVGSYKIAETPYSKCVLGVFMKTREDDLLVAGVGEGIINVCGLNGDIEVGDLLTSSSVSGKGMKHDSETIKSYTVAKARQSVTFSSPDEVKQIACIYLCG